MNLPARIQDWAADRGWGQYALPRSKPRHPRVDHIGLRLVAGTLGLFGVIVIGTFLIGLVVVFGAFIYAAFTA